MQLREFASCVNHAHNFDAGRCDSVKNDVIGMRHDFAQAWAMFTLPIKIRVL